MAFSCRFYHKNLPEVDDVVMVRVHTISELGAYVHLLEYKNTEALILLTELSRRRIRSVNKLIKVGRNECVVVTRVDNAKHYIDLSKRRVTTDDILNCKERYARAKVVNNILIRAAEILKYETDEEFEQLYTKTAWFFDKRFEKLTSAFDTFKLAITDPTVLDDCKLDTATRQALLSSIRIKLTPELTKLRADVEVSCYEYEGIDAVKEALMAGKACCTEHIPVKINLIAPPLYVVIISAANKNDGLKIMETALKEIEIKIKSFKGNYNLITAPKIITDVDEQELAEKIERLCRENEEVDGDNDTEEENSYDPDQEQSLLAQLLK